MHFAIIFLCILRVWPALRTCVPSDALPTPRPTLDSPSVLFSFLCWLVAAQSRESWSQRLHEIKLLVFSNTYFAYEGFLFLKFGLTQMDLFNFHAKAVHSRTLTFCHHWHRALRSTFPGPVLRLSSVLAFVMSFTCSPTGPGPPQHSGSRLWHPIPLYIQPVSKIIALDTTTRTTTK